MQKIRSYVKQYPRRTAFLIPWLFAFVLYASTAAGQATGYGDADELITVGYLLSVAHPPGYPLHTLFTYIFTHLPLPLSAVHLGNLLSSLFQSLTIGVLSLVFYELLTTVTKKNKPQQITIAIISAIIVALNYLLWMYATVNEVFALNNLFAALLVLITLKLRTATKRTFPGYLIMLTITAVSALLHHQTIVTFFPGLAVLAAPEIINFLKKSPPVLYIKLIVVAAISAAIPILLLLLFNQSATTHPISWRMETTTSGIIHFLTRGDFSGAVLEAGQTTHAYLKPININLSLATLKHYLMVSLPSHFGLLGLAIVATSWFAARRLVSRRVFLSLILFYVCSGLIIAGYLIVPIEDVTKSQYFLTRALTERMYQLGYLALYLPLPLGIWWLSAQIQKFKPQLSLKTINTLFILLPISLLLSNYSSLNLRNYTAAATYIATSLKSIPQNTTHICFSDLSCFGLLLAQQVQNHRPDLTIIPVTPQISDQYQHAHNPQLQTFGYPDNPFRIGDIISTAINQHQPVSVSEIPEYYIDLLGLEGNFSYLVPGYYFHQLTCSQPTDTNQDQSAMVQLIKQQTFDNRNSYQMHLRAVITDALMINGTIQARMGDSTAAQHSYQSALELLPDDQNFKQRLAALSGYDGEARYQSQWGCRSVQQLLSLAQQCKLQGDTNCVYQTTLQATWTDPQDPLPRILLAQYFLEIGIPELAKREYRHILLIDPQNPVAKTQLEYLNNTPAPR